MESLGKVYRRIEDLSGAAARTGKFSKQVKNKYYESSNEGSLWNENDRKISELIESKDVRSRQVR